MEEFFMRGDYSVCLLISFRYKRNKNTDTKPFLDETWGVSVAGQIGKKASGTRTLLKNILRKFIKGFKEKYASLGDDLLQRAPFLYSILFASCSSDYICFNLSHAGGIVGGLMTSDSDW